MITDTRAELAEEYVSKTHMCDWVWNERRAELADELGLTNHWQSHAAYLEAWDIASGGTQ